MLTSLLLSFPLPSIEQLSSWITKADPQCVVSIEHVCVGEDDLGGAEN